jgi:hypothetical protein
MAEIDPKAMTRAMLAQLEQDGEAMDGLSLDDLKNAMSHPKAMEGVAEAMANEAGSVQAGESAPDFSLRFLPGSGGEDTRRVTLSEHFGARPVALVFGSYT